MNIAYVPAAPEHRVFVISSWLDSYRDSLTAGMIAMEDWYDVMWPQVEKVMHRRGCRTIVAVNRDEPSQYFGFVSACPVSTPPLVYYLFVKEPHRKWGYGRGLLSAVGIDPAKPFDYSYKTGTVSKLEQKIPFATWQPMLTRFPVGQGRRR